MRTVRSHELEQLRRSIAMLPAGTKAAMDRETALEVLDQAVKDARHVDHIEAELGS